MKKTIEVSIAGIAFRLENEAYELLKSYLDQIEQRYANDTDGREILTDIEARICELILNEQENTQPVPTERIQHIIDQMGLPEDIAGTDENPQKPLENTEKLTRRLYRNPEGAILGGVCSGLGTYFNVEPVLFRLGFFAPLLLTPIFGVLHMNHLAGLTGTLIGVFFMLYFLLLLAIPKAKTPRQKLEMKGEKITASSIRQNFKEDFRNLNHSPRHERSASIWADIVYLIGRILLVCIKIFIGFIACILSIVVLSLIGAGFSFLIHGDTGIIINGIHGNTRIIINEIPYPIEQFIAPVYIGLILLALVLILGSITYMLWRVIFNKPFPGKTIGIMSGIGIVILAFVVIMNVSHWQKIQDQWITPDPPEKWKSEQLIKDSTWVEPLQIGDSTVMDTVKAEYFER